MSEKLYNGIVLPDEWPPKNINPYSRQPMNVPYLEHPPAVIPIDLGRQLFVDDFLLEEYGMTRKYHPAVKHPGNPVFYPETKWEGDAEIPPCTVPKCGGVCYDEQDRRFKMWYQAGFTGNMAYAVSRDGMHWERPELDVVPGSNLILKTGMRPDSGTVWLDRDTADPAQRFKMMIRDTGDDLHGNFYPAAMRTSPDGIHWSEAHYTGPMGDRSTCFYNPFRRVWVQSIRTVLPFRGRGRLYWENADFFKSGDWREGEPLTWCGADCYDRGKTAYPELYALDAAPYENLMVGMFMIYQGPPNPYGVQSGRPKICQLYPAYSRDGFHWSRPDREPLIGADCEEGSWEYGYIEPSGGVLLVGKDEIRIYYSAYAGDAKRLNPAEEVKSGMYANGAVGLATLRRDGFVSLHAGFDLGYARTRMLQFSGGRFFVNANTAGSLLTVECLDENRRPLPGFSRADCLGFRGNSTCAEIRWKNGVSLSSLAGRPIRFLFRMERGDFYSFWVTDSSDGASNGYCGAGFMP